MHINHIILRQITYVPVFPDSQHMHQRAFMMLKCVPLYRMDQSIVNIVPVAAIII